MSFEQALAITLQHEGGLSDDPDDPGGITKWGISLAFLKALGDENHDGHLDGDLDGDGDVDPDDVRGMQPGQARELYLREFWERGGYERIPHALVAAKVFDLAVNLGPHQAHLILQRALRACLLPVVEDGILGPITILAICRVDPDELLVAMRSEAAGVYRLIAALRKASGKFLNGWLNRSYS